MLKDEILNLLRESKTYISGQDICEKYNISRAAVWKYVEKLRSEGYIIDAVTKKGYMLCGVKKDIFNKQEIEFELKKYNLNLEVVFEESVTSTNTYAKEVEECYNHKEFAVFTNKQTAGKGRRGREWKSGEGLNIAMSILLRPEFSPNKASMLTLIAALSVADTLKEENIDCEIKWPNDIVVKGKKICGILTEMSTDIDGIRFVICGIGINANAKEFDEDIRKTATSIIVETGELCIRKKIVSQLLDRFFSYYNIFIREENLGFIKDKYENLLVSKGKEVVIHGSKLDYKALCLGIDENGELVIKKEDESLAKISSGEVSVRGVNGYI